MSNFMLDFISVRNSQASQVVTNSAVSSVDCCLSRNSAQAKKKKMNDSMFLLMLKL